MQIGYSQLFEMLRITSYKPGILFVGHRQTA